MNKVRKIFRRMRRAIFGLESRVLLPLVFNTEKNTYTFTVDNETYIKILDQEIQAIIVTRHLLSISRRLVFKTYCHHTFTPCTEHTIERRITRSTPIEFINAGNGWTVKTKFCWKRGDADVWEVLGCEKGKPVIDVLRESKLPSFEGSIILFEEVNK